MIAVGNDCLAVNKELLLESSCQLIGNESVVGQACDGGAYLIGLSKKAFQKSVFENLAWESNMLFEDLRNYLKCLGARSYFLPKAVDIDSAKDFQTALASLIPKNPFRKNIESLISGFHKISTSFIFLIPSSFYYKNIPLRAPPCFA